jgi:hypothetical protein
LPNKFGAKKYLLDGLEQFERKIPREKLSALERALQDIELVDFLEFNG